MPIETTCTGCGRLLRVADEHAGKQARCPVCQTIYVVPEADATAPLESADSSYAEPQPFAPAPARSSEHWSMRTATGQQFGPVPKERLDLWVTEGRIDATCHLRPGDDAVWISADKIYPQLAPARRSAPANPFADQYAASSTAVSTAGAHLLPHRAGVVFVLGAITWFIPCPLFGLAAWLMGSRDLAEMRAGRMDPSGEGLTQVGRILGMINVVLMFIMFVVITVMVIIGNLIG